MSSTSLITSISATPHAPPTTSSSFSSIPIQSGQPGSSGQPSPSGPPSPLGGPPSPPGQSTSLGPSSSGHPTPSVQSSPSAQPSRSAQPSQSVQPRQSNDHHLSDGAVAGVVIGAAVALALITFLVTFLFMRSRQHNQGSKRRRSGANGRGTMELGTLREHGKSPEPKRPLVTEQTVMSRGPGTWESYLPQSADDKAVKNNVSTLLEQIELHVENFYHNSTVSIGKDAHVELSKFDSPYLPAPLLTLFPQSRSRSPLITHCLTRFIVSSISPTANPERSFLPLDFVVLPNTIETYKSGKPKKPGKFT